MGVSPAASATWTTRWRMSSRPGFASASGARIARAFFASPRRIAWSARTAADSNDSVVVPPACWTFSASASTSAPEGSIDWAFDEPLLGVRHVAVGERGLGRQEKERNGARRGLERAVQGRARVLRAAGRQEDRDERPQDLGVVRRHLERLLVDLDRLVDGAALAQQGRDDRVLLQRVDLPPGLRVEVRQLHVELDVRRVGLDHLLVDADRADGVVVLRVVVRENLVLALRLGREALLGVELGEPFVDVEARRIEPVDLLVDRDAPQEEAVPREVLGDLREVRDRLLVPVQAREEVARPCSGC